MFRLKKKAKLITWIFRKIEKIDEYLERWKVKNHWKKYYWL